MRILIVLVLYLGFSVLAGCFYLFDENGAWQVLYRMSSWMLAITSCAIPVLFIDLRKNGLLGKGARENWKKLRNSNNIREILKRFTFRKLISKIGQVIVQLWKDFIKQKICAILLVVTLIILVGFGHIKFVEVLFGWITALVFGYFLSEEQSKTPDNQ